MSPGGAKPLRASLRSAAGDPARPQTVRNEIPLEGSTKRKAGINGNGAHRAPITIHDFRVDDETGPLATVISENGNGGLTDADVRHVFHVYPSVPPPD